MKVVGIVGLPASGKGEFSRIAVSMGIPVVVMGDVIRKAVEEARLPLTDKNLGGMANRIRAEEGMDAIARRCVPEIRGQDAHIVVVDGIRGDSEVRVFRENFPEFVLVRIDAPFEVRLRRIAGRGRSDDNLDATALQARDEREQSWGLTRALADAEFRIENDGSLESFIKKTLDFFSSLGEEP